MRFKIQYKILKVLFAVFTVAGSTILIRIGYIVENKSLTFIYFPSLCVRAMEALTRLLAYPG